MLFLSSLNQGGIMSPLSARALLSLLCFAMASCGSPGVDDSARCGDNRVTGTETCDDGNTVDDDACTNACQAAACGDGILRLDLSEGTLGYEACDDGNAFEEDA